MNNNKVKINKIEIDLGEKTLELTLEQAKKLKDLLNETFSENKVIKEKEYIPYPYPYRPWYDKDRIWSKDYWIHVGDTTDNIKFTNTGQDSGKLIFSVT